MHGMFKMLRAPRKIFRNQKRKKREYLMVYVLSRSKAWKRDERVWMEKEKTNDFLPLQRLVE